MKRPALALLAVAGLALAGCVGVDQAAQFNEAEAYIAKVQASDPGFCAGEQRRAKTSDKSVTITCVRAGGSDQVSVSESNAAAYANAKEYAQLAAAGESVFVDVTVAVHTQNSATVAVLETTDAMRVK